VVKKMQNQSCVCVDTLERLLNVRVATITTEKKEIWESDPANFWNSSNSVHESFICEIDYHGSSKSNSVVNNHSPAILQFSFCFFNQLIKTHSYNYFTIDIQAV